MADKISLEELSKDKYRDSNASAAMPGSPTAIASLPAEAGRVLRVSQKTHPEGIRQEIAYDQPVAGLAENAVDLRVRTSNLVALDEPLAAAKPTEAGIQSELAAQFPRMTMQIVDRPRSNSYGPYGLAVGRWANGARCIYAWQWIDDVKMSKADGPTPGSVRVRLCRKDATLDQLAGYVDRLQIDPSQIGRPEVAAILPAPEAGRVVSRRRRVAAHRPAIGRPVAPVAVASAAPTQLRPPVAALIAPPPSESVRDPSLDPSLPAAAYRGPAVPSPAVTLAGK